MSLGVDLLWFFSDGLEPQNSALWPGSPASQGLMVYLVISASLQLRKCMLNFHIAVYPEVQAGHHWFHCSQPTVWNAKLVSLK